MDFTAGIAFPLFISICCILVISIYNHFSKRANLPPGPIPLPILGNLLQLNTNNMGKSLKGMSDKYGPVFTVYMGPRRVVMLWGYDAVKEALIDRGDEFSGRGPIAFFDRVLKGYGVNFANGERWKQLHRFSIVTLRNYGMGKKSIEERIQEEAQYLLEEFQKKKDSPFDPTMYFSYATANVICSVVFGQRFDYQDEKFQSLLKMINDIFMMASTFYGQLYSMFSEVMDRLPGPHNNIFQCVERLMEFVENRVRMNQKNLDSNCPRDLVDTFLIRMEQEKENPLSEFNMKNLIATAFGLFLAGTETVSSTLTQALLILLKHPEIEEKMHEEIDRVIGKNRSPSIVDRSKMPYTDAVIHEIQRFIDIFPWGIPHMVTQNTTFRGFTLPKGTTVYPIFHSVLWDPTKFSSPEIFNPGHFLDDEGHFKKNDAFMPFSAGKRLCLGEGLARMELFLYITSILQNFNLKCQLNREEIVIKPRLSGFANIPFKYKLYFTPR